MGNCSSIERVGEEKQRPQQVLLNGGGRGEQRGEISPTGGRNENLNEKRKNQGTKIAHGNNARTTCIFGWKIKSRPQIRVFQAVDSARKTRFGAKRQVDPVARMESMDYFLFGIVFFLQVPINEDRTICLCTLEVVSFPKPGAGRTIGKRERSKKLFYLLLPLY